LALVAALIITSSQPYQAAAVDHDDSDEDPRYPGFDVLTVEEARRSDAATYAENHGVSVEEALRRLDRQFVLGDALDAVQGLLPHRFAGGWVEHDPELAIEVRFTEGANGLDAAIAILEATGVPVSIRTDARHTLDALFAGQERITSTIYRNHPAHGVQRRHEVRVGPTARSGHDRR